MRADSISQRAATFFFFSSWPIVKDVENYSQYFFSFFFLFTCVSCIENLWHGLVVFLFYFSFRSVRPSSSSSSCVSLKGKRVGTSLVEANSSVLLLVPKKKKKKTARFLVVFFFRATKNHNPRRKSRLSLLVIFLFSN